MFFSLSLSKLEEKPSALDVFGTVSLSYNFLSIDRKCEGEWVFSRSTTGEDVVLFSDQEEGFGRLIPFDGSGVVVYFNKRVVNASKGGASALRKGKVVQ